MDMSSNDHELSDRSVELINCRFLSLLPNCDFCLYFFFFSSSLRIQKPEHWIWTKVINWYLFLYVKLDMNISIFLLGHRIRTATWVNICKTYWGESYNFSPENDLQGLFESWDALACSICCTSIITKGLRSRLQ